MIKEYTEHEPTAPLDHYIRRMAYAHFTEPVPSESLAPDSYVKLTFILEGDPWYTDRNGDKLPWRDGFAGHMTPGNGVRAQSDGPVRVLWVNFTPSGFHRLFGCDVRSLTDHLEPVEGILSDRSDGLYKALQGAGGPMELFRIMEDLVLEVARGAWPDATRGGTDPWNTGSCSDH